MWALSKLWCRTLWTSARPHQAWTSSPPPQYFLTINSNDALWTAEGPHTDRKQENKVVLWQQKTTWFTELRQGNTRMHPTHTQTHTSTLSRRQRQSRAIGFPDYHSGLIPDYAGVAQRRRIMIRRPWINTGGRVFPTKGWRTKGGWRCKEERGRGRRSLAGHDGGRSMGSGEAVNGLIWEKWKGFLQLYVQHFFFYSHRRSSECRLGGGDLCSLLFICQTTNPI